MPRTLQFKRYGSTILANTIGANGELIINSTNKTLTVHDGVTVGGYIVGGTGGTGDWTWPNLTRANLGGSQGSYIEGQSPGGLLLYNDYDITLNSNTAFWSFTSDGTLTLPPNGDIKDSNGVSVLASSEITTAGGVTSNASVALDINKKVHVLTNGFYSLASGTEGQVVYFTIKEPTDPSNIKVIFSRARSRSYEFDDWYSNIFANNNSAIITAVYANGAWMVTPEGNWD